MNAFAYHVRHRNGWGTGFGPRPTHCHKCSAALPEPKPGDCTTGYGCGASEPITEHPAAPILKKGETLEQSPAVCFTCCAIDDKSRMIETGRTTLYLSHTSGADLYSDSHGARRKAFGRYIDCELSNWPGSLKMKGRAHIGHHNMARVRYDVTFTGPDGKQWRGTQYGDNTQICHCRRLSK